ncbi:MAG TPA: hypothetical protein VFW03_16250 [Gemmatimonadaceae bacterium]|nr:hypothetical protein [Gemmatimonadaceae bacterium]
MRVGDFSVEVIGAGGGPTRELDSGHVVARPGQVYVLRLRNHGPLRCVADVSIDGNGVTGNGLVINPWSTVDLERPIHATERGRFTVIAEGDERVFGPDGGRDNAALGLIEARFRRELPNAARPEPVHEPSIPRPIVTLPAPAGPHSPEPGPTPPRRPMAPPDWTPLTWQAKADVPPAAFAKARRFDMPFRSLLAREATDVSVGSADISEHVSDAIERAAGTGLTGSSDQDFVRVSVGALEAEATVIRLRLVIGSEEALATPRPLPANDAVPARPAPRP